MSAIQFYLINKYSTCHLFQQVYSFSANILNVYVHAFLYEILFEGFPFVTVYFENITCADGFYLLNYTCRPHCTQFEYIYHSTAKIKIGFEYFAAIANGLITALFVVVVCFNRKTMLVLKWWFLWPVGPSL